jgi:hypothetical protein
VVVITELVCDVYGLLDKRLELEPLPVVVIELIVTVKIVVVPLMTVTVVRADVAEEEESLADVSAEEETLVDVPAEEEALVDVPAEEEALADVVPLFNMGPCDRDWEELSLVLVGVVRENLEVVLVVLSLVVVVVLVLVLVGRNTPVEAANDVVVFANSVLFSRHEAGIVKQQGRPVDVGVLGWNTPV